MSKKKCQFGPVVQFAGYIISEECTRMNPDLVAAMAKFPALKDITILRSLIGLVNRFNDQNPDLKLSKNGVVAGTSQKVQQVRVGGRT